MQVDAQVARCIQEVAKGVFDLRLIATSRISEEVVAHGSGGALIKYDSLILEADSRPGLDGEAGVLTDDSAWGLGVHGDKI